MLRATSPESTCEESPPARREGSFMIGTKLAHYEITAKLCEGGMGVVWKAKDSQLGREVALKLLPEGLTTDLERTARFEREAKVLASLNHPNIAQIYGIEASGDSRALVMELVDGPTLAERLEKGALTLDQSLSIARRIAEALEEAHARGIVHRDLKPQNVKASVEGRVKVLDFGLAKAMDPLDSSRASASQLAHSPTLTLGATLQGVILGTAAYMSPEQARGGAADERADVWAFGVVLWEMLTGRTLFAGPTLSDTLASVLKVDVDLAKLPPEIPGKVKNLVGRCLRKDPRERLHSIADARIVIEEVLRGELDEPAAPAAVAPPRPAWQGAAALAGALVAGAALAYAVARATAPAAPPARVVRFEIQQPEKLPFVGAPKLSPDGRHVAFTGRDESGTARLWLRSLDSPEARPLAGTDGVNTDSRPIWSPDSRHLAYFTGDRLVRVPIDGGPPQKIADTNGADGTWSEQGLIVYDATADDPLRVVPATGGVRKTLVESPKNADGQFEYQLGWPQFLPGGERLLYVAFSDDENVTGIWMAKADGSEPRRVVPGLSRVEYAPPGWLLFVRDATLVAQRFDAEKGALAGDPIPLADGLGVNSVGLADFSVSRDGVLAYRSSGSADEELGFFDLKGAREGAPAETGSLNHPIFSPDGRWLAFDKQSGGNNRDIWLRDLKRGVSSRFTTEDGDDGVPLFSPDGERLYYVRSSGPKFDLYSRPLAVGAEELLLAATSITVPVAVSPDGRHLVIARWTAGYPDLLTLDLARKGDPTPITATPRFTEFRASFSPDGRWLAFQSDESGRNEIHVQPFPGPGRKWQVSTAGGTLPVWSPRGGALYYVAGDRRLTRVAVRTGAEFDAGVPEPLFQLPLAAGTSIRKIALSPDGERLVAQLPAGAQMATPTSVVVGWDASLPR
jgi:Tol biopolymer transport system component